MAILDTTNTFSDGDQVTSTKLNNIIDQATFKTGAGEAVDGATMLVDASGYLKVGTIQTGNIAAGAVTPAKLSTGAPTWTSGYAVGINTNNPTEKLTINGNIRQDGDSSRFNQYNSASTTVLESGIGVLTGSVDSFGINVGNATGDLALGTGNSTRLLIAETGNVGINESSPAEKLHIVGNLRVGSAVLTQPTGSAPMFPIRAWVNFDGTGAVSIRASGNVTSITDNGTGNYTVNLTTAMPNTNYSIIGFARDNDNTNGNYFVSARSGDTKTTSAFQIRVRTADDIAVDSPEVNIMVIG